MRDVIGSPLLIVADKAIGKRLLARRAMRLIRHSAGAGRRIEDVVEK